MKLAAFRAIVHGPVADMFLVILQWNCWSRILQTSVAVAINGNSVNFKTNTLNSPPRTDPAGKNRSAETGGSLLIISERNCGYRHAETCDGATRPLFVYVGYFIGGLVDSWL